MRPSCPRGAFTGTEKRCHLSSAPEVCPICGEGTVTSQCRETEVLLDEKHVVLPMHFKLCDVCTSDFVDQEMSLLNMKVLREHRQKSATQ